MQQYYKRKFKSTERSITIPDKPDMEEHIERLDTIVKHWEVKKSFFKYHSCPLIVAGSWQSFEAPVVILKRN